jgi:3-polyprenyl-4-hydroxybenzoate decarboxylase
VHGRQLREQRQASELQRRQPEADAQYARQLQQEQQQELKAELARELQRLERAAALKQQQQQQQQYEQQYEWEPVYPSARNVHTYSDSNSSSSSSRYSQSAAVAAVASVQTPCSTEGAYIEVGRHYSAKTGKLDMRFKENRALLVRDGVQYNKDGSRSKRQPKC